MYNVAIHTLNTTEVNRPLELSLKKGYTYWFKEEHQQPF